ncbi:hypothetical protein JCM10213_007564 [Rhodosporidiobolus nylandii]
MSRRAAFGGRLTGTEPDTLPSPSAPTRQPAPAQPPQNNHQGGQGGNRGKGKGRARAGSNQQRSHGLQMGAPPPAQAQSHPSLAAMNAAAAALAKAADEAGEDDGPVCFICAEPVQYWAVGSCSHRTCHTCSIRLRALYKKKECTFCKTECPTVVFTEDEEKPFEEYTPESTPFSDSKLGILFETRAQLDDTLSLLRFNCPYKPGLSTETSEAPHSEPEACPQILSGWSDLKRHVRAAHQTTLCDLCCSNKKIFAHEHELFALPPPPQAGGRGGGRRQESELDQHLEKQHAMCGFCRRWFYDSDALYKHCRDQHEECFICTRQGIRHQYHLNYDRLEQHFKTEHFLCPHPECLAQKFVVFESEIDLQAHALSEHGVGSSSAAGGDQKARLASRRIETNFVYSTGESARGGGGGDRRRGQQQQQTPSGRAAAASFVDPVPSPDAPVPRSERRVPGLGPAVGGSGSRAARFGGQLTADPSPAGSGASTPRNGGGAQGGETPDAQTVARHEALMRRVGEAVRGNEAKVAGFKIAVRSYRSGELSAGDLVDQLFNVFEQNIDVSTEIFNSLADLFEDASKRTAINNAWRDLRIEQNQFPSLMPLAPALNGVPTAPHNTSARALAAQHRTAGRGQAASTWDRVERAATSAGPAQIAPRGNPFPALVSASNAKQIPGLAKAGQQAKRGAASGTAWSGSGGGSSSAAAGPSSNSASAFPSLSSSAAPSRPASSAAYTPVSISRPSSSASARAAAGSVRIAPRAASGLEFPSLPKASAADERRARMKAALAKPVGRTVVDEGPSPGASNSWNAGGAGEANPYEQAMEGGAGRKKKGKGKVLLMSSGLASQTY